MHGWEDIVDDLVNKFGFRALVEDDYGRVPLHYAAYNCKLNTVTCLITKMECSPMHPNMNGYTPLLFACIGGHLPVIKYLFEDWNCSLTEKNRFGETPLHLAICHGHNHVVKYLLASGKVNLVAKDKFGRTPFSCVYANRNENTHHLLKLFQPFLECHEDFPVH